MKIKEKFYSFALTSTFLFLFFLISILCVASAASEQSASPAGLYAYIANGDSKNVSVIDTANNAVTASVDVGGGNLEGIAVNPAGTKVYVTSFENSGTVYVIDTATNNVTSRVRVGKSPMGVAVTPDGKKAYVTNYGSDNVSVIDTRSNTVTAKMKVESRPRGVVVNPKGTKVYVANFGNESVSVIDTVTNKVTSTVNAGGGPMGVAVTPDGTRVYVANWGSMRRYVSVIDAATNTVTTTVESSERAPGGVAVTPDGKNVYVTNSGSDNVSVIDTITNKVIATVNVGKRPFNLGQFIVPPVPGITVTSPKNGDDWQSGINKEIKWEYTGDPGSLVNITLLKGEIFDSIIKSSTVIGENGTGSCNWSIPLNQKPGNDYKVKISSTTNPAYNNSSTGNFTISSPPTTITVISPKDGDNWKAGTNHSITWKYTGDPGFLVKIELLKGGVFNRTIKYSYKIGEEGNGSYNWPILPTQKPGNDYKVKISSTTNPAYNNLSTGNFTISSS